MKAYAIRMISLCQQTVTVLRNLKLSLFKDNIQMHAWLRFFQNNEMLFYPGSYRNKGFGASQNYRQCLMIPFRLPSVHHQSFSCLSAFSVPVLIIWVFFPIVFSMFRPYSLHALRIDKSLAG